MLLEKTSIYNNLCSDLKRIGDKLAQLGYYKTQGSQLIKFDLEKEQLTHVNNSAIIKIIEEIPEFKLYETQAGQINYTSHILKCLTPISTDKIESFHYIKKYINILKEEDDIKEELKEVLEDNEDNKKAPISFMSKYSEDAVRLLREDDIFADTHSRQFYQYDGNSFKSVDIKRVLSNYNMIDAFNDILKIEENLTPVTSNLVVGLDILLSIQKNPEHLKNYNEVKKIIESDLNVILEYKR